MIGRDRGRELVAVVEDPGAGLAEVAVVAVLHLVEQAAGAQQPAHLARHLRAVGGVGAALDADEQGARGDAALELLDQQALLGVGAGGKEGRQVGAELRARDDADAGRHQQQPQHERQRAVSRAGAGLAHGVPRPGTMVMTERSPPMNSISTPSTSPPRPLMRRLRTCAARAGSIGSRSSAQPFSSPESFVRK